MEATDGGGGRDRVGNANTKKRHRLIHQEERQDWFIEFIKDLLPAVQLYPRSKDSKKLDD